VMSLDMLSNLIVRMPKCCQAMIDRTGWPIIYNDAINKPQ